MTRENPEGAGRGAEGSASPTTSNSARKWVGLDVPGGIYAARPPGSTLVRAGAGEYYVPGGQPAHAFRRVLHAGKTAR